MTDDPELLYAYGPVAWVWRVLGAVALVGAAALVAVAARQGDGLLAAIALPIAAPVLALFPMVAARIVRRGGALEVETLSFVRRRVMRERIAGHVYRATAAGELAQLPAPRAWIRVRGGLPIHVDLMGRIPDPAALAEALGVPRSIVPDPDWRSP